MRQRTGFLIASLLVVLLVSSACGASTVAPAATTAPVATAALAATAVPAVTVASGATTASPASAPVEVVLKGFKFNPAEVTVKQGTTVTWRNDDSVAHTVSNGPRSSPSGFDSGEIAPGGTFSFTYTEVGRFEYHCKLHSNMDGVVIVEQ